MHGKGARRGRKARKYGWLDRFVLGARSGWKLAALAVALIAMSVMGALAIRRMRGSPRVDVGGATCIAPPRISG
jgi:hypothetical protein